MIRRTVLTTAAVFGVLTGIQGTAATVPAGAADTPGGAVPVWQPKGTPVAGTAVSTDAPVLKPGSSYTDSVKPGDKKYYAVDLDATSSAYLSAFAIPGAGDKVAYGDGIELTLLSTEGSTCDGYDAHFRSETARPVGGYAARTIQKDGRCQQANRYTLLVTRTSAGTSSPGAWPLELRFLSEPGLRAGAVTEPAATATEAAPVPVIDTGRQAHGGTGFDDAAAVTSGSWRDQVLPGETRFYKVPVDWGQHTVVFADFANVTSAEDPQYIGDGVRIDAYNPARGHVDDAAKAYLGKPASISVQTVPVAYANRYEIGDAVAAVRFAGWYYFAVTVRSEVSGYAEGAVPVTLRVDVKGASKPGPAYDGDARKAGFGIDGDDLAAADGTATGGGGSSTLRFVALAALGAGTVLLLTLAGWVLAARNRPRAGDTVPQPRDASAYGPPPTW